jgi:hypothetical protein
VAAQENPSVRSGLIGHSCRLNEPGCLSKGESDRWVDNHRQFDLGIESQQGQSRISGPAKMPTLLGSELPRHDEQFRDKLYEPHSQYLSVE